MTAPPSVLAVHPGSELFGSDRMLLESVIGFLAEGARVTVAVPSAGPLVGELRSAGATVVVAPMFVLRKSILRPRNWCRLARDLIAGWHSAWRIVSRVHPDVVYVSTVTVPQWPAVGRARGAVVVSHVHEAEASGRVTISRALYAPHLLAQLVLANSEYCRATMRTALPSLGRRAQTVLNGVAGPPDPAPPRPSLDGGVNLLYVGRLSPRKGPDLVIDAARQLAAEGYTARVTLVGTVFEGYEWFEAELRQKAAASGVDVTFAGFQREVWSFLNAADILVVPSRSDESFGNTVVEGILALRPVIVSDHSGLREAAAGYATTRLTAVDDHGAIAEAIGEIVRSWSDVTTATRTSRELALSRHSLRDYRSEVAQATLGRFTRPVRAAHIKRCRFRRI